MQEPYKLKMRVCQIIIWLTLQLAYVPVLCLSDEITKDINFYHRRISLLPSKYAILKYEIFCNQEDLVKLDFYTTDHHVNVERRCSNHSHGQLNNEDMHWSLKQGGFSKVICEPYGNNVLYCNGRLEVQDYKPRNFGFSFGFSCDDNNIKSLNGLKYQYSQSDK